MSHYTVRNCNVKIIYDIIVSEYDNNYNCMMGHYCTVIRHDNVIVIILLSNVIVMSG